MPDCRLNSFHQYICLLFLASLFITISGCGASDEIGKRVKVEGIVTVDGTPLPNGSLSFRADETKGNLQKHQPYAMIDPDGKYKIMTLEKEGCAPGWYKVVVESTEPMPEGVMKMPVSRINKKYNDIRQSGISIEVVENAAPGQYDIKLSR